MSCLPITAISHRYEDLIAIFNGLFRQRYNTILVRGEDEPVYLPADEDHSVNRLIFAHGYFASALHETAHWCIAGPRRRKLTDFGYWYRPDGRTATQQKEFERVEVKPQALEWSFSVAAGFPFRFSADNLSGEPSDMTEFKHAVREQVLVWQQEGYPRRAASFIDALKTFYGTGAQFNQTAFLQLPS